MSIMHYYWKEMTFSRLKYFWCSNYIEINKYNDIRWYGTNLIRIYIIFNVFGMRKKRINKKFWKILFFQKSFRFWVQEGSDIINFFFNIYVVHTQIKWISKDSGCIYGFIECFMDGLEKAFLWKFQKRNYIFKADENVKLCCI